ncbi:hypothetical protein BDF21DRAFT_350959, partial [Thamnidium elegans]
MDASQLAEIARQVALISGQGQQAAPPIRLTQPDVYKGVRDAMVIDSWIRSIERYRTFYNMNENQTYLYATTLLRERADAWFSVLEQRENHP